jgi:hypothetical protein
MAFLKRTLGNKSNFELVCASRMRAGTLAILLVQVSCQIDLQSGTVYKSG